MTAPHDTQRRSDEDVKLVLETATAGDEYADGVKDALAWVLGQTDTPPPAHVEVAPVQSEGEREVTDEMVERGARAIHGGNGCTCRAGAKGDARAVLEAAFRLEGSRPDA